MSPQKTLLGAMARKSSPSFKVIKDNKAKLKMIIDHTSLEAYKAVERYVSDEQHFRLLW